MVNMDSVMKKALAIAKAQAGVRLMTAAEVATYVSDVAQGLRKIIDSDCGTSSPAISPKRSIGESYVVCLECGKKFKVLTIRHLKTHGLTAKEYKDRWGIKKDISLTAKGLVRLRRRKMHEMRLWERRGHKSEHDSGGMGLLSGESRVY